MYVIVTMIYLKTLIHITLPIMLAPASGVLLLRIGREPWIPRPGEILSAPPAEAVYGCIWLLAVAVAAWLLCSAVLSICAYLLRIPSAIRAVEWITLGPVQRLAQRIAAAILALGSISVAPPVGAALLPPIPHMVESGQHGDVGSGQVSTPSGVATPFHANPTGVALHGPPRAVKAGAVTGISLPVPIRSALRPGVLAEDLAGSHVEYVVQPGDNMWSVSSRHASRSQADPVSASRVIAVWRQVVDLNRERIESGDPDLIYPGETLLLPDLSSLGGQ